MRRVPAGDCSVPREGAGMVEERVKDDEKRGAAKAAGAYWGALIVLVASAVTGWFGWQFGLCVVAFGMLPVALHKAGEAGII